MENIADKIREDHQPEGEMFDLAAEARRLRSSLKVANAWLDVAWEEDQTGHLAHLAELTRDQIEEQLSRTAYQMELLRHRREWGEAGREAGEAGREAGEEGAAEAAMLSDALLTVYCILRKVPDEAFPGEIPQRQRYAHMGALLVAQEAANAEMERLTEKQPA
jgi:hypothetical protein